MADILSGLMQSNPYTAIAGGILGGIGGLQQRKKQQMVDTEYNKSAYAGLQKTRDSLQNINPYATANATISNLSNAQTGAMAQAANVGAGMAAAAGQGGDINMGNIAALKAATPVMAAAAQFEGQKAQTQQNALNQDLQKQQQLTQTNTEIGNLANHMNLVFQDQPGVLDFMSGAVAGMNKGADAYKLFLGEGGKNTTDTTDKIGSAFADGTMDALKTSDEQAKSSLMQSGVNMQTGANEIAATDQLAGTPMPQLGNAVQAAQGILNAPQSSDETSFSNIPSNLQNRNIAAQPGATGVRNANMNKLGQLAKGVNMLDLLPLFGAGMRL